MPASKLLRAAAVLLLSAAPALAQSPAERTRVDSLIRDVELAQHTDDEIDIDRMHRAEAVFVDGVTAHEKWARAWFGLGLARLELGRADALAREGPELPIGMNNEYGAEHALIRAIESDRSLVAAGNALALAPVIRENNTRMKERLNGLRPQYVLLSAPAAAAAAYAEREAGSRDSAVMLEQRALKLGDADSGAVMVALTRDLYAIGAPREGRATLIAGAATGSVVGRQAYREELAWVASPAELAQWDALPPPDRPGWLAHFWSRRDVLEGRRDGARLEEHYRRIEYAMKNFRITLPKSGRQKLVSMTPPLADGYSAELAARKLILHNAETYPEAANTLRQGEMIGSESPDRYYHPVQDELNDKGVIWIRHGAPTSKAQNHSGPPFEIWRYERPEGPLILYFREVDFEGSAMPNELVPTILDASPVVLNQVCGLDTTLCPTTSGRVTYTPSATPNTARTGHDSISSLADVIQGEIRRAGDKLAPDAIYRSAQRGKEFIDLATTTDTWHRDFSHAMHPLVEVYGLDRISDGASRLLVAFAIPGNEIVGRIIDGRTVYPVEIQVMVSAANTGARHDVDTLRRFVTARPLGKGQFLTGTLEIPLAAGRYTTGVVFGQEDGRGAIATLGEVAVPAPATTLKLSDLVLGRTGSGVEWRSGVSMVPLNPLNAWAKGSDAEVYFQLFGLAAGDTYDTRFEIFRDGDDPGQPARRTIATTQAATAAMMEFSRTLGLANLDAGKYRVRLTVTAGARTATSTGFVTIVNP
jgi:hypothetical protein